MPAASPGSHHKRLITTVKPRPALRVRNTADSATLQLCNSTESYRRRSQRDSLCDPRVCYHLSHLRGPSVRVTPDSEPFDPLFPGSPRPRPSCSAVCAIVFPVTWHFPVLWGNQVGTQLFTGDSPVITWNRPRSAYFFCSYFAHQLYFLPEALPRHFQGICKSRPELSVQVLRHPHHDWPELFLARLQWIPARARQKSLDSLIAQPDQRPTQRATPTLPD